VKETYRVVLVDGPMSGVNFDDTYIPQSRVVVSGDVYDLITCVTKSNDKDHVYYLWRGYRVRSESTLP
jgi:hypothetical protein